MHRIYAASGIAAGAMILCICALILAQIVARSLGEVLPGVDEISISAFVAAIFLGLPYTFWTGGHIRADIFIRMLNPRWRLIVSTIVHVLAIGFVAFFVYFAVDLAWNSYLRATRFQGLLGSPLWIPQSAMVIGLVLFEVSLLHSLVRGLSEESDDTGTARKRK